MTKKTNHKKNSITVRGATFESGAACARFFGISKAAVYIAIKEGRTEFIGLGSASGLRAGWGHENSRPYKPVTLPNGMKCKSRKEAAEYMGVKEAVLRRAINEDRLQELFVYGRLMRRPPFSVNVE